MAHLFCFGLGYSAKVLARRLMNAGWTVSGTCRTVADANAVRRMGLSAVVFDGRAPVAGIGEHLARASHVLVSIPPADDGDVVLAHHRDDLAGAENPVWIGYLSTTGVYGDHDGAWVDEVTPVAPLSARARRRAQAEQDWLAFGAETGKAVHIFRLAGIYGPGRSPLDALRAGTARRITKPDQVFSRIHVDDLAGVLQASMARPRAGAIYNVCDDEPAPPEDVVAYGARLLGLPCPPLVAFEEAGLSDIGRSFYAENKRVRNRLIKAELGVRLIYPSYRQGLAAMADD